MLKKKTQFKGKIPHCEIRPPHIFRCRSKQLGNKEKNELNWGQKYVFDYSKRFMGQFNLHFIDFVPSRVKSLVQGWCRKPLVVKLYHSKWVTGATNICWCQPNSTMKFNLPCIENQERERTTLNIIPLQLKLSSTQKDRSRADSRLLAFVECINSQARAHA